jgi:serine/threonine protein kinase
MQIGSFKPAWETDGETRTAVKGYRQYRAPEVNSPSYSISCDVWSLGILIGQICKEGKEPEPIAEWESILMDIGKFTMKKHAKYRIAALNAALPELKPLAQDCLKFNPESRLNFSQIVRNFVY